MKKLLIALMIVAILLPATSVHAASATGAPGTWVSSINIQNPNATAANVTLVFYDAAGTAVKTFAVPTIAANGSTSIYVPTGIVDLTTGQYSVVATSNVDVNIVVNSSSTAPSTAGAYSGIKGGDLGVSLFFPGLYKNYYGFYSELVLQNTGTTSASISIQFYNQKTGVAVGDPVTDTIASNASKTFILNEIAALPSGNASGLYSAKVTSDKSLAGIANIWSAAYHGEMSDYNAFIDGASLVYVPALYKNYYGFVSSLTVQNLDATSQTVTVTYSNGVVDSAVVAANSAVEFYQPNNASLPSGNTNGVFSAKVTTTGSKIVALVNVENKTGNTSGKYYGLLASYNGVMNPTSQVLCPVVMKEYYNWFSAETIQNVGTIATDITVTYANGMTRTFTGIAANGTVNVVELPSAGSILPATSSLAATITSSNGQPLVAVVQENSEVRWLATMGDYLLAYSCTNR